MILRIFVFYVGSVVLMTLVLPYTAYSSGESSFVTFFAGIGIPHAGDIIQVVVLTATMPSLNADLYATGRTLRSTAVAGEATESPPSSTATRSRQAGSSSPRRWASSALSSTPS